MFNIIKSHHKLIQYFIQPYNFPLLFSTQKHRPRKITGRKTSVNKKKTPMNKKTQANIKTLVNKKMQQEITILEKQITKFSKQFYEQIQIGKQTKINYVLLLARSILISNKSIGLELAYSQLKKMIDSNNDRLTPYLCTALMECLSYYKFDGDEQKILQKLCRYYRENYMLFKEMEEQVFWKCYMNVMTYKVHTSLKFINLERKQQQVFQQVSINQIISKWMSFTLIDKKTIKSIDIEKMNQITLIINKPNDNFDIKIKFIQILNFNQIYQENQEVCQKDSVKNYVISSIMEINSKMKKQWNVIIHGKVLTELGEMQQKIDKNLSTQSKNIYQINQHILNNRQNRQKLLISKNYINGLYYNQQTKQIDIIVTIMLGINKKNLQKSRIRYIKQNYFHIQQNYISNYLSLNQLRQCYGYAKLCQNHWNLFQNFCKVQKFLQLIDSQEEQSQYNLKQIKSAILDGKLTKQQANKLLSSQTQMMTQMTLKSFQGIKNIQFEQQYNKEYKKIHQILGYIGDEYFWQMRPFFNDSVRIMKIVDEIVEEERRNGKKNVKIVIMAHKTCIPYLFQSIAEGRYYTVQKCKQSKLQIREKKQIIKQLYSKISHQQYKYEDNDIF